MENITHQFGGIVYCCSRKPTNTLSLSPHPLFFPCHRGTLLLISHLSISRSSLHILQLVHFGAHTSSPRRRACPPTRTRTQPPSIFGAETEHERAPRQDCEVRGEVGGHGGARVAERVDGEGFDDELLLKRRPFTSEESLKEKSILQSGRWGAVDSALCFYILIFHPWRLERQWRWGSGGIWGKKIVADNFIWGNKLCPQFYSMKF